MSLYHEAAEILQTAQKEGDSLKRVIFGIKGWKSEPKTLFALTTEAAKWSPVLSEVVEQSGVLKIEKNVRIHARYSANRPTRHLACRVPLEKALNG